MKRLIPVVTALFLLACAVPASAAMTQAFTLTVTDVDGSAVPDDPWNIDVGDLFNGQVTYDESFIPATGQFGLGPLVDPTFSVVFELGDQDFDMGMSPFFPFTPALLFEDGANTGFMLSPFVDDPLSPSYVTTLSGLQFVTQNTDEIIIYAGDLAFDDPIPAIPAPTALLLLSTGLIGVARFRKHL